MDGTSNTPGMDHLTNQMQEGVNKGLYTWHDIQQAVRTKTQEAATTTDHYVHENPWQVVGIATALGFVLGLLMAPSSEE